MKRFFAPAARRRRRACKHNEIINHTVKPQCETTGTVKTQHEVSARQKVMSCRSGPASMTTASVPACDRTSNRGNAATGRGTPAVASSQQTVGVWFVGCPRPTKREIEKKERLRSLTDTVVETTTTTRHQPPTNNNQLTPTITMTTTTTTQRQRK